MKLKNAELEETKNLFIKKEKDLNDKIEELGRNREGSNCEGMINKVSDKNNFLFLSSNSIIFEEMF